MKHADKCESCAHWVSDSLISHPADHYGESGRFRYSVTFKLGICHVGSRSVVTADASPDGGRTGRRPAWRTTVPIDGPVMTLAESGCERWTARPIDVDLALIEGETVADPDLVVPHVLLAERSFVLVPLAEVAGGWVHPHLGVTITTLRDARPVEERTEVGPVRGPEWVAG